jgi:hypothetical protein
MKFRYIDTDPVLLPPWPNAYTRGPAWAVDLDVNFTVWRLVSRRWGIRNREPDFWDTALWGPELWFSRRWS